MKVDEEKDINVKIPRRILFKRFSRKRRYIQSKIA